MSTTSHNEAKVDDIIESESPSVDEPSHFPLEGALHSVAHERAHKLAELRLSLTNESVEAYANVLAEVARNHDESALNEGENNYNITQHGVVIWTSQEKKALFQALDKKGRDGIKDIAQAIGSKSELEVQEYITLLHRGVQRQHFNAGHTRTIILGDVPAATEISEECCTALDRYAQLFSLEEQLDQDVDGKQRYKNLWIINGDTARKLDTEYGSHDKNTEAGSDIDLSAQLFNMEKWVLLSERFFMNFGGSKIEDNWVNVALVDETPSITADAFAGFYALTMSITQRLVHTALWFANSRIHRIRDTGRPKSNAVKTRDIRTALNVLNMKRNRSEFWVQLARRCSLDVADVRHRKGWNPAEFNYDEVEDFLSGKVAFPGDYNEEEKEKEGEGEDASEDNDATASESRSRGSFFEDAETHSEYSEVLSNEDDDEELAGGELSLDPEDTHAEALDQQASRVEELQCWTALGQSAPGWLTTDSEDGQVQGIQGQRPNGERKTIQELTNWRDQILYRSDWEEYSRGSVDLYEELSENRRKRQRLGHHSIATSRSPSPSVAEEPTSSNRNLPDVPENAVEVDDRSSNGNLEEILDEINTNEAIYQPSDSNPERSSSNHETMSPIHDQNPEATADPPSGLPNTIPECDNNAESGSENGHTQDQIPDDSENDISSDSDSHLPSPLRRKISSSDEDREDDGNNTETHFFSAPITPFSSYSD